jgi:hypothetical protein
VADEPGTDKIKEILDWQGITMTTNREQEWQDLTLESLEAELRSLGEVEVPQTLEAKILAKVPDSKVGSPHDHRSWRWPRVWGIGIATAAVLILALIFMSNYGPFVSSPMLIRDFNDKPTRPVLADQNTPLIEDTNHVNFNDQR